MSRILVIYAYYEKDNIYKNNLEYFLRKGLDNNCDYIFAINGHCSVQIPDMSNIKIIHRSNDGYDFGAYDDALMTINIHNYAYFIFLNTSVRGPFLPPYISLSMKWYEPFINLIKNNVKLVGTSINILNSVSSEHSQIFERITGFGRPHTHVQSQFFAMDKKCLEYLLSKNLFSSCKYKNMTEFIAHKEIMMSQLVLKNGWNISCIIPEYQRIDYIRLDTDINHTALNHDPCFIGSCFGRTVHPYEIIFIKTNRGISVNEINSLSLQ
jgi:lipopolysaccharide biosynthesis protein